MLINTYRHHPIGAISGSMPSAAKGFQEGASWSVVCSAAERVPRLLHPPAGKYVVVYFYPLDFTFVCPVRASSVSRDVHALLI